MKKDPYGKFAVNAEDDFMPYRVINPDKKKTVAQLKEALKEANELHPATGDDCEGKATAWHPQQVLKPKMPVHRVVFIEIAREAVTRALDNTCEPDIHFADTQETCRILGCLVGYEVSPVLWRRACADLSTERVQSVTTCLIVEREREHMTFRSASYWGVETAFSTTLSAVDVTTRQEVSFTARLVTLDGRRMVTGRDFNDDGQLRPAALKASAVHLHQVGAIVMTEAVDRGEPCVVGVEDKPYKRCPVAPFTTSTPQQEAPRKLRTNPRETIRMAQDLYGDGFITYICADSTVLSSQAVTAVRSQVAELHGTKYAPERPRVYASRFKGTQKAHKAICPVGDHFRALAQVPGELTGAQLRLYEFIWKWTVASQMVNVAGSTATVTVEVPPTLVAGESRDSGPTFSTAGLMTSGMVIIFRDFLTIYEGGRDTEHCQDDAGAATKDSRDVRLPATIAGQGLATPDIEASGHEITPPLRCTEASLVKTLKGREIGCPPTYAATMSTISDRGYVGHHGQALALTWLAFAVARLLEENFAEFADYDFVASMERDLDQIVVSEEDWVARLRRFYSGQGRVDTEQVARAASGEPEVAVAALCTQGLKGLMDNLGEIDARAVNSIEIGEGITLRVGRYSPYLEGAEGKRASVSADFAPGELTVDKIHKLFTHAADDGRKLGIDPASGHVTIAKDDRHGPYVTGVLPELKKMAEAEMAKTTETAKSTKAKKITKATKAAKPRAVSLLRSTDLSTVTLEQALDLLSLPRVVGQDPESREDVAAQSSRYGPYLRRDMDSRSLETEEQILAVTLEQALEIFAQPKRCQGQAATCGPLRELGQDPATEELVVIKDGRFGPYITGRQTNVTVPRSEDPATISAERAFELLVDKRAKGSAKKRTTRKTTPGKITTKRITTKEAATTKKTTAQTAASKTVASREGRRGSTVLWTCGLDADVQRWYEPTALTRPLTLSLSPITITGHRRESWPGTFHADGYVFLRSGMIRASKGQIPIPDGVERLRLRARVPNDTERPRPRKPNGP